MKEWGMKCLSLPHVPCVWNAPPCPFPHDFAACVVWEEPYTICLHLKRETVLSQVLLPKPAVFSVLWQSSNPQPALM